MIGMAGGYEVRPKKETRARRVRTPLGTLLVDTTGRSPPMAYVDGFVIPLLKKNLPAYRRMARAAGTVWKEHGAVRFVECVGDDVASGMGVPFLRLAGAKAGETVLFSFIEYTSRAHRDRVNKKVMADPRIAKMMTGKPPFDVKRMSMGGFKAIVEA
jgi:uncharacterized protein YbaA (DUF1428 family)